MPTKWHFVTCLSDCLRVFMPRCISFQSLMGWQNSIFISSRGATEAYCEAKSHMISSFSLSGWKEELWFKQMMYSRLWVLVHQTFQRICQKALSCGFFYDETALIWDWLNLRTDFFGRSIKLVKPSMCTLLYSEIYMNVWALIQLSSFSRWIDGTAENYNI